MSEGAADPIYEDIKSLILSGGSLRAHPCGRIRSQSDTASARFLVREALRRLQVENLVTFERNRGASVRHVSESEILQLLDIRIALECRALELAVPNMIDADFEDMHKLLADYERRTEIAEWSELNAGFHHMLYEPCGNGTLMSMINDVQARLGQYLRVLVTTASGLERPMREHHEILEACEQRDVESAVLILRKHIERTQKEVAAFLRRGGCALAE